MLLVGGLSVLALVPPDRRGSAWILQDGSGGDERLVHVTTLHWISLGHPEHIAKASLLV